MPFAERFEAQLLSGRPARTAEAVAERLLAIQGQDPRGARLTVRSRSAGLTAADVDRGLTDRTLLITWLNRGTLHLVRSEDYPWLHALTAPLIVSGNARRLAETGVTPAQAEHAVRTIERSLADEGPLTRPQLRDRLDEAGVPTAGQALVHVLILAALRGLTVRGPMIGREHAYALVHDWLPKPPRFDRERALGELARRYLAGHGPAADRDLAKWSGLPLRDARAGLRAVASRLDERPGGLVALAPPPKSPKLPAPRLLGAYDPILLGWASREAILDGNSGLVTVNGLFRPFALVDGKAVAMWRYTAGKVELEPFTPLGKKVEAALEREVQDVIRFLASESRT
ncbi:MAG TPA: winged helix DNA-binding domain-containing protein [Gaiellaceae bacterium]|nr:winged helix DNA-binding domain-containing protein [Gaiellaceae bacterium]